MSSGSGSWLFVFKQKTAYGMRISDWSSEVCSSDLPMPTTSIGRAYVAGLGEADRELLYARLQAHHGDRWPRLHAGLVEALRFHAEHGYVISEGEWNRDVASAGASLVLEGGAHVLAFNCGGSSQRLRRRVLERTGGPRLLELAIGRASGRERACQDGSSLVGA